MPRFEECLKRVDWADGHAQDFIHLCVEFFESKPYRIVPTMRDSRYGVLKAIPVRTIDCSIPLVLGEYFYQLRASLDSTMWKAYEITKGAPKETQLYFPVYNDHKRFDKAEFNSVNLPDKLKTWLRSIQPCFALERAPDSVEAAVSDALMKINLCANQDRHRHLHLAGTYVSNSTALIEVTLPPKSSAMISSPPTFSKTIL